MAAGILPGCISEPTKKIYIKSVKVSDNVRIDWYVHSSITSYVPDYLQISSDDDKPFFKSSYLANITFRNDSLFVSLWKGGYEKLDDARIKGITLIVDTTSGQWDDAISRIGRLKDGYVDISVPHFVDVACSKPYCR